MIARISYSFTLFLCALVITSSAFANAHEKSIAIIGDSVATGAVANYDLDARFSSLILNFFRHGIHDPEGSQGGVNYPENAFPLIFAAGFGVRLERVINVAVNGERVNSIATQFQKLTKQTSAVPDFIFLSFTANDACSEEIFSTSIGDFRKAYFKSLLDGDNGVAGLRYVARAAPANRDTQVFLLGSLNFAQVLTNKEILNQKVPLHFSTVRCERFRAGLHADGPRFSFLADKLKQMCPAVLGTDPKSNDAQSVFRREHLHKIHQAMIEAQAEAIKIMAEENKNPHLKLRFIRTTSEVAFDGRHVANDCFHLSSQGQGRLGIAAWKEIFNGLSMP